MNQHPAADGKRPGARAHVWVGTWLLLVLPTLAIGFAFCREPRWVFLLVLLAMALAATFHHRRQQAIYRNLYVSERQRREAQEESRTGWTQRAAVRARDGTERAIAEASRRLSVRHEAILQAVPDIILETDTSRRYTWSNAAGLEFFGEDLIGKEAAHYFDDGQDSRSTLQSLLDENAAGIQLESWHRRKDGDRRRLAWSCRRLKSGTGEDAGALLTARDITDTALMSLRLQARVVLMQLAKQHPHEKLRSTALQIARELTGSAIGFFHFVEDDPDALVRQGWTPGSLAGLPKVGESPAGRSTDETALWIDCVRQRSAVIRNEYPMPSDGSPLEATRTSLLRTLVVPVLQADGVVAILGVGNKSTCYTDRDRETVAYLANVVWEIAEREQTDRAVAASEARYRLLAENISDVIWTVDRDGCLTYVSPSHESLTGYTPQEALGTRIDGLIAPESVGAIHDFLKAHASPESDATGRTLEVEQVRKDGTRIWVDVKASVLRGPGGEATGFVGVSRDITETRRLRAAAAQADRLASMGMLAAGVSHEINNPLSYVLYCMESLAEELPGLLDAVDALEKAARAHLGDETVNQLLGDRREFLEPEKLTDIVARTKEAAAGARRIKEISHGLGMFSRVEQADLKLVDLNRAIKQAATMAANEIKFRAQLETDLPRLPLVFASEGKLAQVFLNLLVNAAHAIDEGAADRNRIRVRTWTTGTEVFAEVSDTGGGIPAESLDRIFEPFFTIKGVGRGTGLGLPITRNLVTYLGGDISVESKLGQGTRFTIRFPVNPQAPVGRTSAPPKEEPPAPQTFRGRILVVDDEPGIRNIIKRLLGRDHEIVPAASGEDGMAILQKDQRFDLILCDLMMPNMSGMDLHCWLQRSFPSLAAQMVFITGGAFTPRASEYLATAGNLRLEKPFEAAQLKRLVARLVHATRTRRLADTAEMAAHTAEMASASTAKA